MCYSSNYAPTIRIQDIAATKGCEQVLWLYGEDHQVTVLNVTSGTHNKKDKWEKEWLLPTY